MELGSNCNEEGLLFSTTTILRGRGLVVRRKNQLTEGERAQRGEAGKLKCEGIHCFTNTCSRSPTIVK